MNSPESSVLRGWADTARTWAALGNTTRADAAWDHFERWLNDLTDKETAHGN